MIENLALFNKLGATVAADRTKETTKTVYYDLIINNVWVGNIPAKKNKASNDKKPR